MTARGSRWGGGRGGMRMAATASPTRAQTRSWGQQAAGQGGGRDARLVPGVGDKKKSFQWILTGKNTQTESGRAQSPPGARLRGAERDEPRRGGAIAAVPFAWEASSVAMLTERRERCGGRSEGGVGGDACVCARWARRGRRPSGRAARLRLHPQSQLAPSTQAARKVSPACKVARSGLPASTYLGTHVATHASIPRSIRTLLHPDAPLISGELLEHGPPSGTPPALAARNVLQKYRYLVTAVVTIITHKPSGLIEQQQSCINAAKVIIYRPIVNLEAAALQKKGNWNKTNATLCDSI